MGVRIAPLVGSGGVPPWTARVKKPDVVDMEDPFERGFAVDAPQSPGRKDLHELEVDLCVKITRPRTRSRPGHACAWPPGGAVAVTSFDSRRGNVPNPVRACQA